MFNDYFQLIIQRLLPKQLLTLLAGILASNENPRIKQFLIQRFIKTYNVNMAEAEEENLALYRHFNDFFIRKLKPASRPLAHSDIISPVDGYISQFGLVHDGQLIQAKKRLYSVHELLGPETGLSHHFEKAAFMTLYLSPKDYHRIHMPLNAMIEETLYIPGKLFSVKPATVRMLPRLFSRNERLISFFQTAIGRMAMVLVGATIVGSITTHFEGEVRRQSKKKHFKYPSNERTVYQRLQGEEMGYFKLGSTVILLFENSHAMQWLPSLSAGQSIQFGQSIGCFTTTPL